MDHLYSFEVRMGNSTVFGMHLMIGFSLFLALLVVTGAADASSISKKVCSIRKFFPFFFFFSSLIFDAFGCLDELG